MPVVTISAPLRATLFFERYGNAGIPLIFLHGGWGYSLYPITHQLPALLRQHEVLIPFRSGYGQSSRISHFELNFHELAAIEMLAFLDACKISKCILWGHSDGAAIAAWMGLLAPHKVGGIIL